MNTSKESTNHTNHEVEASKSPQNGESTKRLTLTLSPGELKLLASLVSDQLFRRQFIDPKMPGYRANPDEMALGKALLSRLRLMVDPHAKGITTNKVSG
jgi:hypothetical protein